MTEEQIIAACRQGEALAQKMLFELYADRMFILCKRYVLHQSDAEEILSDTFLKCFRFIGTFEYRGTGSFSAWLSKITVNECLAFLRKRQLLVFTTVHQMPELQDDGETEIEKISAGELLDCIRQMPVGYRTVFNLYVLESFSHKEIARQLNISENTSKTQLKKAKAWLRKKIKSNETRV